MAAPDELDERPEFLNVFQRLQISLNSGDFPQINFKPLQVKCLEYILQGQDVIGVLPTGFGKSMIFHLLPKFLPARANKNIVIVVSPLNSIIDDQLKVLKNRRIKAGVLQHVHSRNTTEKLFGPTEPSEDEGNIVKLSIHEDLSNGQCSIVFAHPEALLSKEGRELLASKVFQKNVAACVIDEAHCVELW